ncbi:hypothetical protein ACFU44_00380 [Nocardia rhizosphaerihabitans]|uniref:hypothetical protein n=1 Tax=Nocardia rhizosphaerihabitans TaxID=1691570 RepID=UPI00366EB32F
MSVVVTDPNGEEMEFARGAGFRTEEEHNNLEIVDSDGRLIGAYEGRSWSLVVING